MRNSQNAEEKIPILMGCAEQEEDITLTRVARHDNARFLLRNPELQGPETASQFKGPSKEEKKKGGF